MSATPDAQAGESEPYLIKFVFDSDISEAKHPKFFFIPHKEGAFMLKNNTQDIIYKEIGHYDQAYKEALFEFKRPTDVAEFNRVYTYLDQKQQKDFLEKINRIIKTNKEKLPDPKFNLLAEIAEFTDHTRDNLVVLWPGILNELARGKDQIKKEELESAEDNKPEIDMRTNLIMLLYLLKNNNEQQENDKNPEVDTITNLIMLLYLLQNDKEQHDND